MFGFFKKKANAVQVAGYLLKTSPRLIDLDRSVDAFLEISPQYSELRNKIIDELQWIVMATGVIAVRVLADVQKARAVIEAIDELYVRIDASTEGKHYFTPERRAEIKKRLEAYYVRFNRGIAYRPESKEGLIAAIADVGNESMRYITGRAGATEVDWDMMHELQERTVPADALELYVVNIVDHGLKTFAVHFNKLRFV